MEGFEATKTAEKDIAAAAAELTCAFAQATVAKVNVVVGQAYGSAALTMNSKSIGADLVYAWPGATIGMMDPTAAARVMYADEIDSAEDKAKTLKDAAKKYKELQSSAKAAAARGYVDHIITPEATRKYLVGAFEMLYSKREDVPPKKHTTV